MTFQSTPSVWRETVIARSDSTLKAVFQSTPSVWRETSQSERYSLQLIDFNPLPPCGGRPQKAILFNLGMFISIHSLRVEGDESERALQLTAHRFQSTPSVWRETFTRSGKQRSATVISIHSLRVEGDQ